MDMQTLVDFAHKQMEGAVYEQIQRDRNERLVTLHPPFVCEQNELN